MTVYVDRSQQHPRGTDNSTPLPFEAAVHQLENRHDTTVYTR